MMTYSMGDTTLSNTTYTASAFTVIAGLTINEWVAIAGLCLGIATFLVNLYFKNKHYNHLLNECKDTCPYIHGSDKDKPSK